MTATSLEGISVALLYEKFGPYHAARLKAARETLDVTGVELSARSADYSWFRSENVSYLVRLFPDERAARPDLITQRAALNEHLDSIDPDVVALPGWSDPGALLALEWCGKRRRPAIMMCDSTYFDAPRFAPAEWTKKVILSGVSAGFVSGSRSTDYLEFLGLPRERIATGYDVVDNRHFCVGAEAARSNPVAVRAQLGLPTEYCLFVGRLIERKNLDGLLRAYAIYRATAGRGSPMHLVVVGEGEEGPAMKALAVELGLSQVVQFFGHADYSVLPALYGLAEFFILPSFVEQWGLVLNEALACGLPVLVSNRSGASADLVEDGRNGFVFDPKSPQDLAEKLCQLADRKHLDDFRVRSREIVAEWNLDRFARGLAQSAHIAMERGVPPTVAARITTRLLLLRAGLSRGVGFWN